MNRDGRFYLSDRYKNAHLTTARRDLALSADAFETNTLGGLLLFLGAHGVQPCLNPLQPADTR
jgi:hypothetical protein